MVPRYLIFNKPDGVLSQFTDEGTGHATLKDYIDVPRVYAAGRLDLDSEGLLLLTDDGNLIKQLTDPKHHAIKVYWVQVEGELTAAKLNRLESGVTIQGYPTLPCEAKSIPEPVLPPREKPVTPHGPTSWLEMRLREGKKRQIRHMTAAVGLFTLRLIRVSIGPLRLGALAPGAWRELSANEIQELKRLG